MDIDNAVKIANIIETLSSVKQVNITSTTITEINARILEFAKALKFKEEELESLLNEQST